MLKQYYTKIHDLFMGDRAQHKLCMLAPSLQYEYVSCYMAAGPWPGRDLYAASEDLRQPVTSPGSSRTVRMHSIPLEKH